MNELTQDQVRELFDYRDGNLYWKVSKARCIKIGDLAGCVNNTGYRHVKINGKSYLAHRLIFLYHHGFLPKFLDHIDGNKPNNSIDNLREVTHSQNNQNRREDKYHDGKPTSSRFKGVCLDKRREKWVAQIQHTTEHKYLGSFASEIEAAKCYNDAAIKLFGEFAHLNTIPASEVS